MNKKKIAGLVAASILLLGLGAFSYSKLSYVGVEERLSKIVEMDPEARQKEVDKIVKDGMINVQYTPHITVDGNYSEGFNIKNSTKNKYPLKFRIVDSEGKTIYNSKLIEIGYEMKGVEFTRDIEKGKHEYKILIGYDAEGNVESSFPLYINSI